MYNILIVDDDFRDCKGICNTIKKFKLPLQAFTAECGKEALNILKHEKINILITDIQMPDMLGTKLAEEARNQNPNLVIILVSAHKNFQYAQSAINFGAMRYLLKPYFINDLVSTLNDAINTCNIQASKESAPVFRTSATNSTILNFLSNKEEISAEHIKTVIGSQEIQLVEIKILKHPISLDEMYKRFDEIFAPRPFIIPLQNSEFLILNQNKENSDHKYFESVLDLFIKKYQSEICITYSPFTEILHLPEEYKRIRQITEHFFFSDAGIVVSTDDIIPSSNTDNYMSVDLLMDKIYLFIDIGNYTEFVSAISLLFNTLKQSSHFSSLYAKCISSNILNRIYKKHKFKESEQEIISKIFSSGSADEIVSLFEDIVNEITVADNKADTHRLISKSLSIIETEYMDDISLEYIAEKLYISPSYLSRLFKKEIGKTFIEFLKEYRLKKACELLKNTNLRVTEISKMVGYDSSSYFNTIFHKFYNTTPAQYREKGNH